MVKCAAFIQRECAANRENAAEMLFRKFPEGAQPFAAFVRRNQPGEGQVLCAWALRPFKEMQSDGFVRY